jgi:hypothetical protein
MLSLTSFALSWILLFISLVLAVVKPVVSGESNLPAAIYFLGLAIFFQAVFINIKPKTSSTPTNGHG